MSSRTDAAAMQSNMTGALGRRPAVANAGATTTPGAGRSNPQYDGRRMLTTASMIRLDRIASDPDQPRKTFGTEADDRLADSMRVRGQYVPVLVRWDTAAESYRIIDGDRRFRAAGRAGLTELACVVENESDPRAILEVQLVTNALREDVAPVEQAEAWDRLMRSYDPPLTHRALAEKLGYDHRTVGNALALLDLPPEVQARVDAGAIPASTGVLISKLDDPKAQRELAERVVAEDLNRAEVAAEVRRAERPGRGEGARKKATPKGKPEPIRSRTFRGESGLRLVAERARGIDPAALLALLERATAKVRAELAGGEDRDAA